MDKIEKRKDRLLSKKKKQTIRQDLEMRKKQKVYQ